MVMHVGSSNPGYNYNMEQPDGTLETLQASKMERYLGVQVADTMKAATHCQFAARKASAAAAL